MMTAVLWWIISSLHTAAATGGIIAPSTANRPIPQTPPNFSTSSRGNPVQAVTVAQLTNLVLENQYLDLEGALKASADIPPVARAFFEGVLANRENRTTDSLRELELALADYAEPLAPDLQTIALRTLADNYTKAFRYGDAADTYSRLLKINNSSLTESDRKILDGSRQTMELLRNAPLQTVVFHSPFQLPTKQNALGLAEVQLSVGGQQQSWILDTWAGQSLVTVSLAHRLGLTVTQATAPLAGPGGKIVSAHAAVIPELKVGTATFRHMAVLVVEDQDFYIPQAKFQFNAILGYPALSALGSVTLYSDGGLGARKPLASEKLRGSQMMVAGLTPLVAVTIEHARRLFLLDTGTQRTYLCERYWQEHKNELVGQQPHDLRIGGEQAVPAYTAGSVAIDVGGVPVTLKSVSVLSKPTATGGDNYYGVLGQDVMKLFGSCTLDFHDMRYVCKRGAAPVKKAGGDADDDDD